MNHQIHMERTRDCVVPDKTYWGPIPIHRVNSGYSDSPISSSTKTEKKNSIEKETVKMSTDKDINSGGSKSQPPAESLQVLNYSSILPRKKRSDLYSEIESRK